MESQREELFVIRYTNLWNTSDWMKRELNSSWLHVQNQSLNIYQSLSPDDIPFIVYLEKYIAIVLCVLGLVGNSFSSATFLSKQLRRSPCSVYLAVRGLSDNVFLANLAISRLANMCQLDFSEVTGFCKCIVFFTYVSGFVSVWLTVLVTSENLTLLKHPQRAKNFNRNNLYKTVCLCLFILAVLMYTATFWLVDDDCSHKSELRAFLDIFLMIDMCITFAIPSFIIVVLLVLTVIKVTHIRNTRARSFSTSSYSEAQNLNVNVMRKQKRRQPIAKVTVMLFIFTLTFILLHLPSHVLRSCVAIASMFGLPFAVGYAYFCLHSVFQIMYYLSFSVNVLVFLSFGSNFRTLFQHRFCGFRTDMTLSYVPSNVLRMARYRQRRPRRRHTISVDIIELASLTLSKEWLNLPPLKGSGLNDQ